jgi:hypothetical protein
MEINELMGCGGIPHENRIGSLDSVQRICTLAMDSNGDLVGWLVVLRQSHRRIGIDLEWGGRGLAVPFMEEGGHEGRFVLLNTGRRYVSRGRGCIDCRLHVSLAWFPFGGMDYSLPVYYLCRSATMEGMLQGIYHQDCVFRSNIQVWERYCCMCGMTRHNRSTCRRAEGGYSLAGMICRACGRGHHEIICPNGLQPMMRTTERYHKMDYFVMLP